MGVRLLLALCAVHAVHLVHPAVGDSCDSKLRPRSPQNELRDHLLCNYDFNRAALSTYEKNVTSASQFVVLNSIDYIEWGSRKEAIINTLQNWTWYDVRLIWNPNSYHGISSIWLDPQRIWTPDAMFVDLMESLEFAGGRCRVTSAGHVTCSATSAPRVACEAHLASWPHDGATCTLYQVAGDMALEKLDLNLDSEDAASKFSSAGYRPNRMWKLLKVDIEVLARGDDRRISSVLFLFRLQRRSALYGVIFLLPALVLPVLTLATYWVDPGSPARMRICCVDIFTHVYQLQALGYELPTGAECPRIILYYRDSMLAAGFTMLVAVVLQWLSSEAGDPPSWCARAASWLADRRYMRALLLVSGGDRSSPLEGREDVSPGEIAAADRSADANPHAWKLVIHIADRILFLAFASVYSILLLVRVL
ncbi:acetylcholine receptor subunit beta-like isoform X2 [Bacillus rossius redtenbacheri]|uniref:acetylcholine receptor subunit beta-like isoform X2 n=1 Tax=Bacillus rossius redtenbacheri TaxID=93214 RepID=UPI002FDEE899